MKKALGIALILALSAPVALAHGPGKGMLEKLDGNADGKVTKQEASAAHKAHFTELDSNRDGKLSKDELAAGFKKRAEEHEKAREQARKERSEKREARMREHGAERFAEADANKDGALDAKEFAAGFDKHFARLDADGNGVVEKDELRHGRSRGRGHGRGPDHDDGECEHDGPHGDRG